MIVMKFGGTSVGSGEALARVAGIVAASRARRPVVVVSAMAGVTDLLLQAAARAGAGDLTGALTILDRLRERHDAAIAAGVPASPARDVARDRFATHAAELSLMLEALALLRERGPKADDAVSAYGELWSSEILAQALVARDVPGVHVDARRVMITDATFGRAAPDRATIAERVRALADGEWSVDCIPVLQGFVGATPDGLPTTLGRGGSDYTAALLGAALDAEEVEIWTDVDGLMTADPRIVPGARTLAEATYDEAAELAYFGAKVLHPATVLPLVERGIPVRIKNSLRPDHPGTAVTGRAAPGGGVRSIASKRGVTTLALRAPRMLGAHGFMRAMFEVFDRHGAAVDVVTTSEVSVSLSLEQATPSPALLADLQRLGDVTTYPDRAVVCVVGEGLRETPGVAARIFRAVGPANIEMISQGASEINVTFILQDADAPDAVRRLHAEFFSA
jgi:aspartate kinase